MKTTNRAKSLVALSFFTLISLGAQAEDGLGKEKYYLVRNKENMPSCYIAAKPHPENYPYISLESNKDLYIRAIRANYRTPSEARDDGMAYSHNLWKDCFEADPSQTIHALPMEEEFRLAQSIESRSVLITENSQDVFGLALSKEAQRAFAQIRKGANVFRPANEETPEQFLAQHPMNSFGMEENKALTNKYGMAFTSGLFKAWLESNPVNAQFRSKVMDYVNKKSPSQILEKYQNTIFVIVKGYGHNYPGNPFNAVFKILKEMKLDARLMDTDPYGRIDDNSDQVAAQLSPILKEGKKVVIIAGSVGVSEAIGAMTEIQENSSIVALVSFSGMMNGSYLANWATEFPQWLFVRPQLYSGFNQTFQAVSSPEKLDSFKSLRTDFFQKYFGPRWSKAPKDLVVINLVGTILNGLNPDGTSVRIIQDKIVRPVLTDTGANDGYIEFPDMLYPAAYAKKSFSLVTNASHNITDGEVEGINLGTPDGLSTVLTAVLNALATEL